MSEDETPPTTPGHTPVLPEEVVEALDPRPGAVALDCTAGLGGHAVLLAGRIGPGGTLVLNDADPANLESACARVGALRGAPRIVPLRGNFADAPRRLAEMSLGADAVLADLGFSSTQMETASRGLSFMREGPLDMRFDPTSPVTAADLVNSLPERELVEMLRDFGEERNAPRIARKIVEERAVEPITTTLRLAGIVRSVDTAASSVKGGRGHRSSSSRIDPATRTFQALRIAVNDELGSLSSLLESVERAAASLATSQPARRTWLNRGARVALISFHSLEDRLVKRMFAELGRRGWAEEVPVRGLRRGPVGPSPAEEQANPRSRSAKLRAVQLFPPARPASGGA